jgi:SNF2 family DNA or RNA helicase
MTEFFVERGEEGQMVGAWREVGKKTNYVYDMEEFRAHCAPQKPAYLDFILRPPVPVYREVDWSRVPVKTQEAMFDYQRQAVDFVVEQKNGRAMIVAEMGMGKTLMACVVASQYEGPALFVVPAGQIWQMRAQWAQWIGGSPLQVLEKASTPITARRVVASFEVAKRHVALKKTEWVFVAVDECQYLKGESQRAEALVPLLQSAQACLLMSGTPQENNPRELYNLLSALHPETFKNRRVFTERYCEGHVDQWGRWSETGARYLQELHFLMGSVMFRRSLAGSSVALPPKHRHLVTLKGEPADLQKMHELQQQRVVLQQRESAAKSPREATAARNARNVHVNLMLRTAGSVKARVGRAWLHAFLAEHAGEKVVLFFKHLDVLKYVKDSLPKDVKFVVITGSTAPKERVERVESIRLPEGGARVALLTLGACSTGITLCPGAHLMVMVEMDHVPSEMEQAEGRIHRIGATAPSHVYWWVLEGSIEEGIVRKLESKAGVNSLVLSGNKQPTFLFT